MKVASGHLCLKEHIEKVAKMECMKLRQISESRGIRLVDAVIEFLEQYKAEIAVKKEFIVDYQVLEKPFDEMIEAH